jgi:folate-binding Fe-S cluster repair protein YgfZ
VQHISSNDAAKLKVGQIQYSGLMTPAGTFVDDLLVYRWADDHFLLVVNASNIEGDFAWIKTQVAGFGDVVAVNSSARYALIAVQGPLAREVLQPLTGSTSASMKYYWFATARSPASGAPSRARGTPARTASRCSCRRPRPNVWKALLEAGQAAGSRAGRPRRTRHAATRGRDAALRQRHRRVDHRARGRPRLDRRLEQARVPRPRRAGAAEGRRGEPPARRLRDDRARHRAPRLRRLVDGAPAGR